MKNFFFAIPMILAVSSCQMQKAQHNSADAVQIIYTDNYGGEKYRGFKLISNTSELHKVMTKTDRLAEIGTQPSALPKLSSDERAAVYYLGTFSSGSHGVNKLLGYEFKDGVLSLFVPQQKREAGMMEIQVISEPWFVIKYPTSMQVKEIKLVGKTEQK